MMKKIDNISDKNPFRVPEGYFDEVNRKIISLTSGKIQTEKKSRFYHGIRPYLIAAASVTCFLVLSYTVYMLVNTHKIATNETAIIQEEYYSPLINDIDIYSVEENAATIAIPERVPDVSKAEIIDYLMLNNIELSEIYEQL
jgi:hypothetical protein